jgi:DNA-binding SARP family transcriptional activator
MVVGVRLLGGFEVVVDGTRVAATAWRSRRAAQLVALLALADNHQRTTEQVMDALWPDLPPQAARANLHKTATLARQAMGSKESVVLRGDLAMLWPSADVRTDVDELEQAARRALASAEPEACAEVARRYAGELLPQDGYEEWAEAPRHRVQRLQLDLLRAGRLWAELAEADPTDEEAHRELMSEHFRQGRLHAAIRQFQRARTVLARELGVLPSPQTAALYRRIVGTASSGWARPALVGREPELVRARATLRRAAEGRPAAIFVNGPAGIGKTRLCEELVEQAAAEQWLVLPAVGREQTASVPYRALVEALQAVMVDRPYLANALGHPENSLLARLTSAVPDQGAGAVHRHALLHLLSEVSGVAGASRSLLFLDDAHHVDDDTLALAEALARAPARRGALLLASYRPGRDPRVAAMARSLVAAGIAVEIGLGALDRADTDAIVGGVLDRPLSDAELGLAWQLSEGNPFFALEVAASLAADGPPSGGGAYGAVDVRIERLPEDVRRRLRSVAVVAQEFTADEYAALAMVEPDPGLGDLETGLSLGVLARQGSSYRFRHDLVRDRITESVPEADRAAAHAQAAERLAGLGGPAARVAHHLLAAGRDRDAAPWLTRAARDAVEVGAHADALATAERGLAIVPGDPALLALRADAMNGLGDPRALAAYSAAIAVSAEAGRAALIVRLAKALILAGEFAAAFAGLAAVRSVPPPLLAQFHVARALALWCTGAIDEAEEAGKEAKRLAEATAELRDFVDATMVLAMVAHERGAWPQRLSLDLLDPHLAPGLAAVVIDAHLCVAESYLDGGVAYDEVTTFARDLQRLGAAAGAPRAEAFATTLLGEANLLIGDIEAATGLLRAAVEQHRRVGVLCGVGLSLQRLAQAHLAGGALEQAQAALAGALTAARGSPVGTRHLLDRVHGTAIRAATDPAAARMAVDEARRGIRGPFETCPPCSVNLTVPAAIACADAGDLAGAAAYLARSEEIVAAYYPRGGWHPALDEVRGHLARAGGDVEAAGRLLRAAGDAFEQLGQRLDAARCRRHQHALATAGAAGAAGKV